MIEQLFGSKTRYKLLQLFLSNPNRSFYVREITRKIDEQINSVRRELANLLSVGVITSDTSNNRLYYEVNQDFEYYDSLSKLFVSGKDKSSKKATKSGSVTNVSNGQATRDEGVRSLGNVQLALLSGQFTRDERPGVDLVLVGDINRSKLDNYISELERTEKKEIRYAVFSEADFKYRRQINDRFTVTLLDSKLQILVDRDSLLTN